MIYILKKLFFDINIVLIKFNEKHDYCFGGIIVLIVKLGKLGNDDDVTLSTNYQLQIYFILSIILICYAKTSRILSVSKGTRPLSE